jgi:hypothetical protein
MNRHGQSEALLNAFNKISETATGTKSSHESDKRQRTMFVSKERSAMKFSKPELLLMKPCLPGGGTVELEL